MNDSANKNTDNSEQAKKVPRDDNQQSKFFPPLAEHMKPLRDLDPVCKELAKEFLSGSKEIDWKGALKKY